MDAVHIVFLNGGRQINAGRLYCSLGCLLLEDPRLKEEKQAASSPLPIQQTGQWQSSLNSAKEAKCFPRYEKLSPRGQESGGSSACGGSWDPFPRSSPSTPTGQFPWAVAEERGSAEDPQNFPGLVNQPRWWEPGFGWAATEAPLPEIWADQPCLLEGPKGTPGCLWRYKGKLGETYL